MTKIEEQKVHWFADACGYIVWCIDHHIGPETQLHNLQNDIIGLQREDECFAPRLDGYEKFWKG